MTVCKYILGMSLYELGYCREIMRSLSNWVGNDVVVTDMNIASCDYMSQSLLIC